MQIWRLETLQTGSDDMQTKRVLISILMQYYNPCVGILENFGLELKMILCDKCRTEKIFEEIRVEFGNFVLTKN